MTYPAQLVQPSSGELTWLVDETAASLLRSRAVPERGRADEANLWFGAAAVETVEDVIE
jgi:hypothetical protein